VSALNKGGSSDHGTWRQSAIPHKDKAISDIYTENHNRYDLLIVTLLA
jgi:hypothetical protein